jgi:hypothetical protein
MVKWYIKIYFYYFAVVGRMTGEIYEGGDGNFIGNKDLDNSEKQKWKRYR